MITYLVFGLGFYIGLAMDRKESFREASLSEILRGAALGILAWPIGLLVAYKYS